MSGMISNAGKELPFLLETGPGPSDEQLRHFHRFLRQLRRELIEGWYALAGLDVVRNIEYATDYLIHMGLLEAFISGRDRAAAQWMGGLLRQIARPSIRGLHRVAIAAIKNPLLRRIFALNRPSCDLFIPGGIAKLEWADRLAAEVKQVYGMAVPTTVFGDYHQLCMDDSSAGGAAKSARTRHNFGVHYTPAPVVDYLTCRALRFMTEERGIGTDQLRILDPSCGCGAFLVAAFRFMTSTVKSLSLPEKLRLLSSGIHGCDIDQIATTLTIQCLLLTVWGNCVDECTDHEYAGRMPDLTRSIACADFLRACAATPHQPNVILGGPPFVRIEQLHKGHADQIEYYRSRFATARAGQFDLYMLFIERALEVLAPGGCLAFSVSGSFLRSKSGRTLRQLISSQCRVIEVVEFDDRNVYPDATMHLTLLTAWKTDNRSCSRYVSIIGTGRCRDKLASLCHRQPDHHAAVIVRPFPSCALAGDEWRFDPPESLALLRHMESTGTCSRRLRRSSKAAPSLPAVFACSLMNPMMRSRRLGRSARIS